MVDQIFSIFPELNNEITSSFKELGIKTWADFIKASNVPGLAADLKTRLDKTMDDYYNILNSGNLRRFTSLPPQEHWCFFETAKELKKTAFIDIETTGRQLFNDEITLVGIFDGKKYISLIKGINLNQEKLADILNRFDMVVTYKGLVFDIPFLQYEFPEVNLDMLHFDLYFASQKVGFSGRGNLREYLSQRGCDIPLERKPLKGYQVVQLWQEYEMGHKAALELIKENNEREVKELCIWAPILYEMLLDNNQNLKLKYDALDGG